MYPVLPLRDIVVFPHMIVPLFVGRDKSVRALEDVMKDDKQILLVAQKNAAQDDPTAEDIYKVGTVSTVLQLLKLPDGTVKVLVEGVRRAKISRYEDNEDFFLVEGEYQRDDHAFVIARATDGWYIVDPTSLQFDLDQLATVKHIPTFQRKRTLKATKHTIKDDTYSIKQLSANRRKAFRLFDDWDDGPSARWNRILGRQSR